MAGAAQHDKRILRDSAEIRMRDGVALAVAHVNAERILVGIAHQHAQLFLFHANKMPKRKVKVNAPWCVCASLLTSALLAEREDRIQLFSNNPALDLHGGHS